MRHMEGFVDKQSYREEGRVLSVVMEYDGHVCYVWLVLKRYMDEWKNTQSLLQDWAGRELVKALEEGTVAIQREVNRFGKGCVGDISSVLCIYYRGSIFACGEENGALKGFQRPWGVYISSDVTFLLKEQLRALTDHMEDCGIEQQAHSIKRFILKALSQGELEQGYFFLWEDFHV